MGKYSRKTKEELLALCKERGIETEEGEFKAEMMAKLEDYDWLEGKESEPFEEAEKTEENELESVEEIAEKEENPAKEKHNDETSPEAAEKTKESLKKVITKRKTKKAETAQKDSGKISKEETLTLLSNGGSKVRVKKKERIYHDNHNEPLMIDSRGEKNNISEEEMAERELLLSQSDHHAYLSGTIQQVTGITKIMKDGEFKPVVNAVVNYKGKKISIMTPWFFEDWENIPDEEILKSTQCRIGSEVDFVIIHIEEDGDETRYFGSRIEAMTAKRREYWFGKKRKNGETVFRINEGDIVEARVAHVTAKNAYVEVFGVEVGVPAHEIAYEYINDVRERYHEGDRVKVRITEIERDMSTESLSKEFNVKIKASIKSTLKDPREKYYDDYNVNDSCIGIVTRYNGNGDAPRFFVNVAGEVDVLCWLKRGVTHMPIEGDKVTIKISRKYDKYRRMTGTITHVAI